VTESNTQSFSAGERLGDPAGDPAREAIASLRGYGYQLYASALAWLRLSDGETLFLEIAEDYAIAVGDALAGVQVKDTAGSGSLTINSPSVAASVDAYVDLVDRNTRRTVTLRHLTTSPIGRERSAENRIEDGPTLDYWRRAAVGAPIAPLRTQLLRLKLKPKTREFIEARDDDALREELIRRVHWDAGQAALEDVADELRSGLIEFAAGVLRLSADVGRKMVDTVLTTVLRTSIKPEGRRLSRADLIELGEALGRVSLPRGLVEAMLGASVGMASSVRETLLVPGELESGSAPVADRRELVGDVERQLSAAAFAVVTGSTGMGKTHAAARAAIRRHGSWRVADFRWVDAPTAATRLAAVLGELAASSATTILLDDLECVDDPPVRRAVQRLVMAMRRRDGAVLMTSAAAPARRSLDAICGSLAVVVEVPYLTIEEVSDLVEAAGGHRNLGRLIHLAGSAGHPQLVQAAILHMRAADWSRGAIRALLGGEASDIAEERRVARDRFVSVMPSGARTMLFRTSLIYGRFSRALALTLADVEPAVAQPGAEIDRLVGPWIERVGGDQLRVSPLVSTAGREILSPAEGTRVHRAVADFLLRSPSLSVNEGDAVLHHAMEGGDPAHLTGYAHSVLTASSETLELLARHAPAIALLKTDRPIFPANPTISLMLRLAQLLVALAGDDLKRANAAWMAMRTELAAGEEGARFEIVVLSKILIQTTIVDAIPEWLDLLVRFDALSQTDERLLQVAATVRSSQRQIGGEIQGFVFIHQATKLRSTQALRVAFEQLDTLNSEVRKRLFSGLDSGPGHYGHLVDAAWLHSAKTESFDGEQAADDYRAVAEFAERWGNITLAARCHAARATMLDEYVKDSTRALAALAEAEAPLGRIASISRARAKIHWQSRNHGAALRGLEEVWNDKQPSHDEVERGFIAREAGISAAETGDWASAGIWFERARACFSAFDTGSMPSLKIGLCADAAQAAFKAGDAERAIAGYAQALEELKSLDPDASLNAAYCHRVVRNAILWLMRETRGTPVDFEETVQPPGACSNPDPVEAIRGQPLGPLDMGWYLLADAALDLGQVQFFQNLYQRLGDGPILGLEVGRQKKFADHLLSTRDVSALILMLPKYGAGLAYLEDKGIVQSVGDIMNPTRGTLPVYVLDGSEPPAARRGAIDLAISFAMVRAMEGDGDSVRTLRAALGGEEWTSIRGLARLMVGAEGEPRDLAELTATSIAAAIVADGLPVDPGVALAATIRFLLWVSRSEFKSQTKKPLDNWAVTTWSMIIDRSRFRLRNPQKTAPVIAEALAATIDPLVRVARLALAAEAAVPLGIPENVRRILSDLAQFEENT
jgi:tetratricopeptide (TPR) repeat protein